MRARQVEEISGRYTDERKDMDTEERMEATGPTGDVDIYET